MDLNAAVVLGSIGEEEPTVVSVTLFAVIDVGLVVGLRKFLLLLMCYKIEVATFFITCLFLVISTKCSALDTILVLSTNSRARWADFTGWTLKL